VASPAAWADTIHWAALPAHRGDVATSSNVNIRRAAGISAVNGDGRRHRGNNRSVPQLDVADSNSRACGAACT